MAHRFASLFPAWDLFEQVHNEIHGLQRAVALHGQNAGRLWHDDDFAYLEIQAPGVRPEQLELTIEGDELTLKINREDEPAKEQQRWLRRERELTNSSISVTLPFEAETDAVDAELANGVLWIRTPKAEAARPTRVLITSLAPAGD